MVRAKRLIILRPRGTISPHPLRIATLRYVHLGFFNLLPAEKSAAEGSVGQIFKCLKRLDDFHANPKRAGSVEKRRKGFGDPIWRFAESLRFACLRQNPRTPKENWPLQRPSREFAILWWRREWDSNPRYGCPYTRFPSVRLQPLGHLSAVLRASLNLTQLRLYPKLRQVTSDLKELAQ